MTNLAHVTTEVEAKLMLNSEDFRFLQRSGQVLKRKTLLNVYYDCGHKLASKAVTCRVRMSAGADPVFTLKMPVTKSCGDREAVEIESVMGHRIPAAEVNVWADLPPEIAAHLMALGVTRLERLGWMRTERVVVLLAGSLMAELDAVSLPDGSRLYEAEVENEDDTIRRRTVQWIREHAPSAQPSHLSKYERFVRALAADVTRSAGGKCGTAPPCPRRSL
jgi:uncharacterized protein YjbK